MCDPWHETAKERIVFVTRAVEQPRKALKIGGGDDGGGGDFGGGAWWRVWRRTSTLMTDRAGG